MGSAPGRTGLNGPREVRGVFRLLPPAHQPRHRGRLGRQMWLAGEYHAFGFHVRTIGNRRTASMNAGGPGESAGEEHVTERRVRDAEKRSTTTGSRSSRLGQDYSAHAAIGVPHHPSKEGNAIHPPHSSMRSFWCWFATPLLWRGASPPCIAVREAFSARCRAAVADR